jgi:hypothetical protein
METKMKTLKIALVAAAALSFAAPAFAQDQPSPQYQRDLNAYQDQRNTYERQQADYASRRADYDRSRTDYQARRDRYESDRADYDARYGYGAYARVYGAAPAWDDNSGRDMTVTTSSTYTDSAAYASARRDFDRRARDYERKRARYDSYRGYGAYARVYGPSPVWGNSAYDVNGYGRDTAYTAPVMANPCYQSTRKDTVAGAGIGALVGAALGSNVAAHGRRTEGTVLGALVGAGLGGAVGNAHAKAANAKCDQQGLYFSYNDTYPYSEANFDRVARSGDYDYSYYARRGCRLAPAPANDSGDELRYIRVCPDNEGHYRVTS